MTIMSIRKPTLISNDFGNTPISAKISYSDSITSAFNQIVDDVLSSCSNVKICTWGDTSSDNDGGKFVSSFVVNKIKRSIYDQLSTGGKIDNEQLYLISEDEDRIIDKVKDPTEPNHAANKNYVDTVSGMISSTASSELSDVKTELTALIDETKSELTAVDDSLRNDINFISGDISGRINSELTNITSNINTVSSNLHNEITSTETELNNKLTTETEERKSGDEALGQKIDNKVQIATWGDSALTDPSLLSVDVLKINKIKRNVYDELSTTGKLNSSELYLIEEIGPRRITNVDTPVDNTDATNKKYVDDLISTTKENINNLVDGISSDIMDDVLSVDIKLDDEITARTEQYTNLNNAITAEITNRENALTALESKLENAISAGDESLETLVSSVSSDIMESVSESVSTINDSISAEENARTVKDTELENTITSNYNTLTGQISSEKNARETADNEINTKISTINQNLGTETSKREESDTALSNLISAKIQMKTWENADTEPTALSINTFTVHKLSRDVYNALSAKSGITDTDLYLINETSPRIISLVETPEISTDAANKMYVDDISADIMSALGTEIGEVTNSIGEINSKVEELQNKDTEIEGKVTANTGNINTITTNLDTVTGNVGTISTKLDNLSTKVDDIRTDLDNEVSTRESICEELSTELTDKVIIRTWSNSTQHTDAPLSSFIINKINRTDYDALSAHNETELYLIEENGSRVITNVANPSNDTDAANKVYVDTTVNTVSSAINSAVSDINNTLTAKDTELNNAITAETKARTDAISGLDTKFTNDITALTSKLTNIKTNLSTTISSLSDIQPDAPISNVVSTVNTILSSLKQMINDL